MAKMTNRQIEQRNLATTAYTKLNASDTLIIAKPLRGVWYYYEVPMINTDAVAALISDVENTGNSDGLKFRFRPTNSVFYRVANMVGATPKPLASVETVDSLVIDIAAETGSRVNRGHAVERLITELYGREWHFNPLQSSWWKIADLTTDTNNYQIKAYGGSIVERDIRAAVAASNA